MSQKYSKRNSEIMKIHIHGYWNNSQCDILHSVKNIIRDSRWIVQSQYSINNEKKMYFPIWCIIFYEEREGWGSPDWSFSFLSWRTPFCVTLRFSIFFWSYFARKSTSVIAFPFSLTEELLKMEGERRMIFPSCEILQIFSWDLTTKSDLKNYIHCGDE